METGYDTRPSKKFTGLQTSEAKELILTVGLTQEVLFEGTKNRLYLWLSTSLFYLISFMKVTSATSVFQKKFINQSDNWGIGRRVIYFLRLKKVAEPGPVVNMSHFRWNTTTTKVLYANAFVLEIRLYLGQSDCDMEVL